jgi:hypothetical protein
LSCLNKHTYKIWKLYSQKNNYLILWLTVRSVTSFLYVKLHHVLIHTKYEGTRFQDKWFFYHTTLSGGRTFLVHLDQRSMWTIAINWWPSSVVCKFFTSFFSETTGP